MNGVGLTLCQSRCLCQSRTSCGRERQRCSGRTPVATQTDHAAHGNGMRTAGERAALTSGGARVAASHWQVCVCPLPAVLPPFAVLFLSSLVRCCGRWWRWCSSSFPLLSPRRRVASVCLCGSRRRRVARRRCGMVGCGGARGLVDAGTRRLRERRAARSDWRAPLERSPDVHAGAGGGRAATADSLRAPLLPVKQTVTAKRGAQLLSKTSSPRQLQQRGARRSNSRTSAPLNDSQCFLVSSCMTLDA